MSNFLKNVEHDRYNIDDIKYKTFICKDCTKKNKEFELHTNDESPKDLLNYGYISLQYLDNPFVYVTTPPMVCLFGVDKNTWNMSLQFKDLKPLEKYLTIDNNPPKFSVEFFKEQKNLENINCFSDEGNRWEKANVNFDKNTLKINFREKFIFRRGRINCSLNDNGIWRWFGIQFSVEQN